MRIIIVDDEELARSVVREHLASCADAQIIAECSNGFEAVHAVTELKPDLVFLDVQMPTLSGFEVLELLDTVPAVVFVTAYDAYALRAFDVHAVDYLLKPFSRERFEEAMARARRHVGKAPSPELVDLLADRNREPHPAERILIREGSKVLVIPVDTIDYIEAQDDYVAVHVDGKRHLKQQRLSTLEGALDPARFVRIHRSYILNIDRLARLEPYAKDSRVAILKDETRLHVSRSGYKRLKDFL